MTTKMPMMLVTKATLTTLKMLMVMLVAKSPILNPDSLLGALVRQRPELRHEPVFGVGGDALTTQPGRDEGGGHGWREGDDVIESSTHAQLST